MERVRVLIWGKTYPELSAKYVETVCTGGIREDGTPIRLYPMPFRYLNEEARYSVYDWIEVDVERNETDPRPESHRVLGEVRRLGNVGPDNNWKQRRTPIFSAADRWHFENVAALQAAEDATGQSLGMVQPATIERVAIEPKAASDRAEYEKKLAAVSAQPDLFRAEFKELEYPENNIRIHFRCAGQCTCADRPHGMKILDWGVLELARKKGWEAARAKVEDCLNGAVHDARFFMGNFRTHPKNFGIVGLWYPKRDLQAERQRSLF